MKTTTNLPAPTGQHADFAPPLVLPSSSGMRAHIVRSIPEVETMREIWTSWRGHRDSDVDCYLEFIQSHQEVLRPHVIVLYRDQRPDAMLIGRLERMRVQSRIGYLRLPGILARGLTFVYGGLRGNPSDENSAEFVRSIMDSLRGGEADLAFLHQPNADSPLYKRALSLPGFGSRDHLAKPEPHYLMRLPGNIEELYQGFSRSLKVELRKKKKKILEDFDGSVRVDCFREPAELDRVMPHIEEVAKKTYQRGLGVGFEDTPQMRRRLQLCAEKGWLRVYILYIGDSPCSYWTGTVYDGVFTGDYNGYDPSFREYSLGSFIVITMIEDLCKEGVKEVDFGPGQGEYKERFGNRQLMEASVHIFAPSAKGFMLNVVRTLTTLTDRLVKQALDRTNLLPRVKRLWRNRATKQG